MTKRTLSVGLLMLTLVLPSCFDATGGGWIVSASDPNRKAHFGFSFHCTDEEGATVVRGNLQYNDKAYTVTAENGKPQGLSIKGALFDVIFGPPPLSCAFLQSFFGGRYSGDYLPQPQTLGPGGTFELQIEDLGQQGPSKEDVLTLSLTGGVFGGYSNSGTLEGGQITVHLD